jgi:hypothetical protein
METYFRKRLRSAASSPASSRGSQHGPLSSPTRSINPLSTTTFTPGPVSLVSPNHPSSAVKSTLSQKLSSRGAQSKPIPIPTKGNNHHLSQLVPSPQSTPLIMSPTSNNQNQGSQSHVPTTPSKSLPGADESNPFYDPKSPKVMTPIKRRASGHADRYVLNR